jgi:anti-sigma-K factor RskA
MSDKHEWQKSLDDFLKNNPQSADTRVLARALAEVSSDNEAEYASNIADLETALHIEQNIDAIGLQATSTDLQNRLNAIAQPSKDSTVIWPVFKSNWRKISAIAASVVLVAFFYSAGLTQHAPQQPSLAEIKQAEQELKIAFAYLAKAQTQSSQKLQQTLDENIQQPINNSLLRPLEHLKESS